MSDDPIPRSEAQGEREAALRAFIHPGEAIDAAEFGGEQSERELELFRHLVFQCMPAKASYGGRRRWHATFRRMVATVYVIAPEVFEGRGIDDIARMIGVQPRAFKDQLAAVRVMIAMRRVDCKKHGSFPGVVPAEVPREARPSRSETFSSGG